MAARSPTTGTGTGHDHRGTPASRLLYFAHDTQAAMLRLAYGLKRAMLDAQPVGWLDDAVFFDLGVARRSPLLVVDGRPLDERPEHAPLAWLRAIDVHLPDGPALSTPLDDGAWDAVLAWRSGLRHLHARLIAPVAPAMRGIGDDPDAVQAYKRDVEHRFGQTLEELANDRYGAWQQFMARGHLRPLARHLAAERFYFGGRPSIADCVIAADLHPLQLHDGVHLPIDLLYYLRRVEDAAGVRLADDWLAR